MISSKKAYCLLGVGVFLIPGDHFFPENVEVKVEWTTERVNGALFYIKGKFSSLCKMLGSRYNSRGVGYNFLILELSQKCVWPDF